MRPPVMSLRSSACRPNSTRHHRLGERVDVQHARGGVDVLEHLDEGDRGAQDGDERRERGCELGLLQERAEERHGFGVWIVEPRRIQRRWWTKKVLGKVVTRARSVGCRICRWR
jgi:hypothetical protein